MSDTKGSTNYIITSIHSEKVTLSCEFIILTCIVTSMPERRLNPAIRKAYCHVKLADPKFDIPAPIDFLLCADIYSLAEPSIEHILHHFWEVEEPSPSTISSTDE